MLCLPQTLRLVLRLTMCLHPHKGIVLLHVHSFTPSFPGHPSVTLQLLSPDLTPISLQSRETQGRLRSLTCSQVATWPHLTAHGLGGQSCKFIGKLSGAFTGILSPFSCSQGRTSCCTLALVSAAQLGAQTHGPTLNPFHIHRLLSLSGTCQARNRVFSGQHRVAGYCLGQILQGFGQKEREGTIINPTAAPGQSYILVYCPRERGESLPLCTGSWDLKVYSASATPASLDPGGERLVLGGMFLV